jgi:hypothetical protein
MESSEITYLIKAFITVVRDERLRSNFTVHEGLSFHLKFEGLSHPAVVNECTYPLEIGKSGHVELNFVALRQEKPKVSAGLKLTLVGGIDLLFAEGEILEILDIREG